MVKIDKSALSLPWLSGKNLPKKGVEATVTDQGREDDDGLIVPVRYKDGQRTIDAQWRPRGLSLGRCVAAWGDDTKAWVGQKVHLEPRVVPEGKLAGKIAIEAVPK